MKRMPSAPVTPELEVKIKHFLDEGLYQHQIAAALGINQGRISEVKTGKLRRAISRDAIQLHLNLNE